MLNWFKTDVNHEKPIVTFNKTPQSFAKMWKYKIYHSGNELYGGGSLVTKNLFNVSLELMIHVLWQVTGFPVTILNSFKGSLVKDMEA